MAKFQTHVTVFSFLLAGLGFLVVIPQAPALISVVEGNSPIQDLGFPKGTLAVANLPFRVAYSEGPPFGGGMYTFEYTCDSTQRFNETLKAYAAIKAPILDLVVSEETEKGFHGGERPLDFTFMVWVTDSWKKQSQRGFLPRDVIRMYNSGNPRLTVMLQPDGPIDWERVQVPKNLRVTDQRIAVAPVEDKSGSALRGVVRMIGSEESVQAAEAVLVEVDPKGNEGDPIARALTDDKGVFQIEGIPEGNYRLKISKDEYATWWEQFRAPDRPKYQEISFLLSPAGTVKGAVVDTEGNPIPGVKVRADDSRDKESIAYPIGDHPTAITDEAGRFTVTGLPRGTTRISCWKKNVHKTKTLEYYAVPSDDLRLVMEKTGVLQGRVVDANGNPPGRKIQIHVRAEGDATGKWGGSRECEEDGTFLFEEIPPGTYLVTTDMLALIQKQKGATMQTVTVEPEKTAEIEVVAQEIIPVRRLKVEPEKTR